MNKGLTLQVSEIFWSIDGEGIRTGYPAIFIRLFGCNLHCIYCDSKYACIGYDYVEMSIDDILSAVATYNCKRITLTGGEPLMQQNSYKLISRLLSNGYEVNVETNGSIDISNLYACCAIGDLNRLIITMDWKSVFSGACNYMQPSNLNKLRNIDVLKFVVADEADLNQMKDLLQHNDIIANVFVSPVFGKINPSKIVEFILNNDLNQVRIQLQLHKLIWDPDKRGV